MSDLFSRRSPARAQALWVAALATAGIAVALAGCSTRASTVASTKPSSPVRATAPTAPSPATVSPAASPATVSPAASPATVAGTMSLASPRDLTFAFGSLWVADGPANNVVRFDPATNAIQATISVPDPASVLASGDGAIWLTSYPGDSLTRIDPTTNTATKTISLGPASAGPIGVAVVGGFAWVASHDGTPSISLLKVDAAKMKVVDVIPAGTGTDSGPVKVVSAAGSIWTNVSGGNVVLRIDPRTDAIQATVRVDSACGNLVGDDQAIWVAGGAAGDGCVPGVSRIDPTSNTVSATVKMAGDTNAIALAPNGALWACAGSSLVRIDESSATVTGRWTLPATAFEETFAGGFLWVTDRDGAMLYKIKPS